MKGHSGVEGDEAVDRKANIRAYGGRVMARVDRVTPAGIRQEFPIHMKPKHMGWRRQSVKGLIMTDRGPLGAWLKVIGRKDDDRCECGEVQNAAHLLCCPLIGDGKGRSLVASFRDKCMHEKSWH